MAKDESINEAKQKFASRYAEGVCTFLKNSGESVSSDCEQKLKDKAQGYSEKWLNGYKRWAESL